MFRFLYYKGYIDMLDINKLTELRRDIIKDYKNGIIEKHQYDFLIKRLNKKLNKLKVQCI